MAVSPTRAAALGDIAKARGMGDIARASGLTREALALQGFAPRRSAALRDRGACLPHAGSQAWGAGRVSGFCPPDLPDAIAPPHRAGPHENVTVGIACMDPPVDFQPASP